MITRVWGAALSGIEPFVVTVETDVQRGIPRFEVVGLANGAIQEGKNRIISALRNLGIPWNAKRVTVNLAPASIRKEGAALDLPISLGLLAALQIIPSSALERKLALGELALDGTLRPIRGGLTIADFAHSQGYEGIILPYPSAGEVGVLPSFSVLAPRSLGDLLRHFRGEGGFVTPPEPMSMTLDWSEGGRDWSDVGGQAQAKRALEISASGVHNVLLTGPPGVGKTLLARRLPTILPSLEPEELREVQRIHSIAQYGCNELLRTPSFRAPQHSATFAGMAGGGKPFRPGEFTLAHRGVLFMDEMPEFRRDVIEGLREPLEDGEFTLARLERVFRLPAQFLLLGAMNLCPCGALGDPRKECICTPPAIEKYRGKISGPVLDRIDLHVELPRPAFEEVWKSSSGETSSQVRARVLVAREKQRRRQTNSIVWNGKLTSSQLRVVCALTYEGEQFLSKAVNSLALSARSIDKTLRVARTIADLAGDESVHIPHLAEAISYRPRS